MTQYVDHYFDSPDASAFLALLAGQSNVLGPLHGRAAIAERVDEAGQVVPACEAVGDPTRVYIAVRAESSLSTPSGAVLTDPVLAQSILGVWA